MQYDEAGLLVLTEEDSDGGGIAERITKCTYNAKGRILNESIDDDGASNFELYTDYNYDCL